jgi:Holliday junction resolvase RusA-like endonuclease
MKANITDSIAFRVRTVPVSQPRQRVAVIAGRARNYTPAKHPVNTFKAAVQIAADGVYNGPPIEGPLRIEIDFVFARPATKIWKRKPMPRELHAKKPDLDNLSKAVLDALNQQLFRDDSQLAEVVARKWIAAGDEPPHVAIVVERFAGNTAREAFTEPDREAD